MVIPYESPEIPADVREVETPQEPAQSSDLRRVAQREDALSQRSKMLEFQQELRKVVGERRLHGDPVYVSVESRALARVWAGEERTSARQATVAVYAESPSVLAEWQLLCATNALRFMWPPAVRIERDTSLSALTGSAHYKLVASRDVRRGTYVAAYVGRAGVTRVGGDYFLRPVDELGFPEDLFFGVDGHPKYVQTLAKEVQL